MKRLAALALAAICAALMMPPRPIHGQITFTATELLGRPTDSSIALNVVASTAIQAYVAYGTVSGTTYPNQTGVVSAAANEPLVIVISGLQPDTRYYYRLMYRPAGTTTWLARDQRSFSTKRAAGSTFAFTVIGDSHINIVFGSSSLYQRTLQNVAADRPDFHLDLGDTFAMDNITTQSQANNAYLSARSYFGLVAHSSPLFLVLGNHEQEEAWHLDDTGNPATSKPVLGANARKRYYLNPNPIAEPFYTGNLDVVAAIAGDHRPDDYYAWEWGDALFVVIDPYWYTTRKPFTGNLGGGESSDTGSGDRWDWTLGFAQYTWLQQTLENSQAKYKFIFAHHGTGGTDDYIRGGANAVPYGEWGGRNEDGTTWAFDTRRPGWALPVHNLLVQNKVSAFFHAHDHEFAYEKRDGLVYQLLPMPSDSNYGYGSFQLYRETDPYTIRVLPNSGHLRVTVGPSEAKVEYVRAFLAGAGTNGQVAYSYTIPPAGAPAAVAVSSLSVSPTSVVGGSGSATGTVTLNSPVPATGATVALSSSNVAAATVPASVTVPANALSATFPITTLAVTSSTAATIAATLNGTASATLTVMPAVTPPPAATSVRLNSGGSAYTDTQGQRWSADGSVSGGSTFSSTRTIANTVDSALYQNARYGSSFTYTLNVPAGTYAVTLKFAELFWSTPGSRVFNVSVNGAPVLSNFDIVAAGGGNFRAVDRTFTVSTTGPITIRFTAGPAGNALVNAIQVVPAP